MKCPICGSVEDKVIESRQVDGGSSIRRRRECLSCSYRFTSYEHVKEKKIIIKKRDGRREPFNREKLEQGIRVACQKRAIAEFTIQTLLNDIEDECTIKLSESSEIDSQFLGELVSNKLMEIDQVAYIRFASVYKQFDDVKQFISEIKKFNKKKKTGRRNERVEE